jgi:hypothetical protein
MSNPVKRGNLKRQIDVLIEQVERLQRERASARMEGALEFAEKLLLGSGHGTQAS